MHYNYLERLLCLRIHHVSQQNLVQTGNYYTLLVGSNSISRSNRTKNEVVVQVGQGMLGWTGWALQAGM